MTLDRKIKLAQVWVGLLTLIVLLCGVVNLASSQTLTAKLGTRTVVGDSVKQTLSWSVSGFTADSFVITQTWTAIGRNVDKNGAAESATGTARSRAASSTRSKVVYWRTHYGNTERRDACVVAYKAGNPVALLGSAPVTATSPTWKRERYAAFPPLGTADSAFLATTPSKVDTVTAVSISSPAQESYRLTSSSFNLPGGTYTFTVRADDGVRVWLDGVLLFNEYRPQAPTTFTKSVAVAAGAHRIVIHYFNNDATGVLNLSWALTAADPVAASTNCATQTLWMPWKDGIFISTVDSALARTGTVVIVGGILPKRLTAKADTVCRSAATSGGLSQLVDLRACMALVDTTGAAWCLAVLDSAHSWGSYSQDDYDTCDKTFYRAIRGKRW